VETFTINFEEISAFPQFSEMPMNVPTYLSLPKLSAEKLPLSTGEKTNTPFTAQLGWRVEAVLCSEYQIG
jgi:hypothetical protein